jgi:hypothetical protein
LNKIPNVDGHLDLAKNVTLFGNDKCPPGIDTTASLHKIADVVPYDAREAVLSSSWLIS